MTKSASNIIEVRNFSMRFGDNEIIKDLSFTVKKGEVFGLLGSNGSGKTTTIRALLDIYRPSSGELLINGEKFVSGETKAKIGYLPEERGLYKKEPVLDVMMYFARLKGVENPRQWIEDYLAKVGLSEHLKTRVDKLSQGQQQKLQLGITIMNDPDVLILDEPTKGFDPINRKLLMNIIADLHRKGSTIILITHYMNEVEDLCDNILLLKDGIAAAQGSIKEVRKQFNNKSLEDIFVKVYGAEHLVGGDAYEAGEEV